MIYFNYTPRIDVYMQQEGKADHSNLQVYSCKVNYARREYVQGKEIE